MLFRSNCDMVPPGNKCLVSVKSYKWNATAYQMYDSVTPGMEGEMSPFDALWVKAYKSGLKLRFTPSAGNAPIVEEAAGGNGGGKGGGNGGGNGGGDGGGKGGGSEVQPWHLRIVAEAGAQSDPGNAIGQLASAKDGLDAHDLEEFAAFGNYLTVLFDNPDLGDTDWGYTSDFRSLDGALGGDWPMQVRSVGKSRITLKFEGSLARFKTARLLDKQTGSWTDLKAGATLSFDVVHETHSFLLELR